MRPIAVAAFCLIAALVSAPSCPGGGGGGSACRCDTYEENSKCTEMSAPPAYAAQLDSSCSTVQTGCDTTEGAVYADEPCDTADVVAECTVDYFSYVETQYFYSTGGEPYDAAALDVEEEDCTGEFTRH